MSSNLSDTSEAAETQVVVEVAGQQPAVGEVAPQPTKLTPEQEEEIKLRNKYPNPNRPPCGSALVQKLLHKGSKKYFDSGDYNMARSKIKANNQTKLAGGAGGGGVATVPTTTEDEQKQPDNTSPQVKEELPVTNSITIPLTLEQQTTPHMTNPNLSRLNHHHHHNPNIVISEQSDNGNEQNMPPGTPILQTGSNHSISPGASSSASSGSTATLPTTPLVTAASGGGGHTLSSSVSTSSIHHHNHHLIGNLSLSSSVSTDKLSNIQLNPVVESGFGNMVTLDGDEIGHGIPTPECLPQSRKHSIAQSKLATPRLSTS